MLHDCGLMPRDAVRKILRAIEEIEQSVQDGKDGSAYDGRDEDFFYFLNRELRERLDVGTAGRLHTGRSRNDVDQTVLRMALRERLLDLASSLAALVDTLIRQAHIQRDTLVVAYTHGQPAQPTTWGHYLLGLTEILLRDGDRLLAAYDTVDRCPMGAAAITTTGFAIDRAQMARLLGFATSYGNSYGAIAGCDYATSSYAAIEVMLLNLGRFIQDLGSWSGFEVGHIDVPDAFVQRSSIMPQKRNPVAIEHLRLLSSLAVGHCHTVLLTMHNTPFTDMNDNEYTVHATGYEAIEGANRTLRLLDALVGAVRIDEEAVRAHIEQSSITMTEVADSLVRHENICFAQAHDVCTRLASRIGRERSTLATVPYQAFVDDYRAVVGKNPSIAEPAFRALSTPENFIAVRTRPGGPAREPMDASLIACRDHMETLRSALAAHRRRLDDSATALETAAERLSAN